MILHRYHQINTIGEKDMKIVYNNIIPFEGFKAMACVWWIFARKGARMYPTDIRHENIHGAQQREMLLVFFLLWYGIEWLVRLCIYRNPHTAYKNICFEREAYDNESDIVYLDTRKHFAFIHYIRN